MTQSIQEFILNSLPTFRQNAKFFTEEDIKYFLRVSIPSFLISWKQAIKDNTVSPYEEQLMKKVDVEYIVLNELICSLFKVPVRNNWTAVDLVADLNSKVNKVSRWNTLSQDSKNWLLKGNENYTRDEIYQIL